MNNKTATCLLVVALFITSLLPLSAQVDQMRDYRFSDIRTTSMGSGGIAFDEFHGAFPKNPAVLFRLEEPLFRVATRFSEQATTSSHTTDPVSWLQSPVAEAEVLFSNRYISLSLGLANVLTQRTVEDNHLNFIARNISRIQITASYGIKALSFGIFAQGGGETFREVEVRSTSPFRDYIANTYLERYRSLSSDDEAFVSGFGMLLSYQWFSIALMTDSLFRLTYDTNELVLDPSDFFRGAALGVAFSTPQFNQYNELRKIVAKGSFDATNLGNVEQRKVHFGLEGILQLLPNLSFSLRTGYFEFKGEDSPLFTLDGSGTFSLGLSAHYGNASLDVAAEFPLKENYVRLLFGMTWGF
ncbi:MAG: hypothetical protein WCY81_04250 [Sphaerochaetaceae bacterium]